MCEKEVAASGRCPKSSYTQCRVRVSTLGRPQKKPVYGEKLAQSMYRLKPKQSVYGLKPKQSMYGLKTKQPVYGEKLAQSMYGLKPKQSVYGEKQKQFMYALELKQKQFMYELEQSMYKPVYEQKREQSACDQPQPVIENPSPGVCSAHSMDTLNEADEVACAAGQFKEVERGDSDDSPDTAISKEFGHSDDSPDTAISEAGEFLQHRQEAGENHQQLGVP